MGGTENKGPAAVNLQGLALGDEAGLSGLLFPAYMLPPDSFVIVCAASSLQPTGHIRTRHCRWQFSFAGQ